MSQLGMGVMIGMLSGNESSANAFQSAIGKTITSLEVSDKELRITLEDGSKLILSDEGQSCCEHRYMHTDDDLSAYIGSALQSATVEEAPSVAGEYGEPKDSAFLKVTTSKGTFTVVNYNEHNGYYGGFLIRARAG